MTWVVRRGVRVWEGVFPEPAVSELAQYDAVTNTPRSADTRGCHKCANCPTLIRTRNLRCRQCWFAVRRANSSSTRSRPHSDLDEMAVQRFLGGDTTLKLTKAEKIAVTSAWRTRGRSLKELERLTGWNVNRYRRAGLAECGGSTDSVRAAEHDQSSRRAA